METARFVPPAPRDMNIALANLESFIHSEGIMPILIKVGVIHAQFETIHPFLDGNGRIGRLLITLILCCEEVLHKPLLYLSHFFKVNRWEYYELLQKVHDDGDWESWLKFFLRGVFEVAQEATITARNIVLLRERHREVITTNIPSSGNAYRLLEYLYNRPIITVRGAANVTGLSYANANNLIADFVKIDLLHQMDTHRRNRRFVYSDYLAMFVDEEVPGNGNEHEMPLEEMEKQTEFTE